MISIVVHLPRVQRWMGWVDRDGTARCPFGHDSTTTAEVPVVPVPTLRFTLGATHRADVLAWATAHGVRCTARRSTLECSDVSGDALGAPGAPAAVVWFELAGEIVRAVRTSRPARDAEMSVHTVASITATLAAAIGAPVVSAGELHPRALVGALAQISREYRGPNVRAVVRATHMGDGFVVTESYASVAL
jgi:hypothetical protein